MICIPETGVGPALNPYVDGIRKLKVHLISNDWFLPDLDKIPDQDPFESR